MPVEITPFVKKYAPWSASKSDIAEQCPLKFKHTYVHKTQKGRPKTEALVGIALHRILELSLAGKPLEDARKQAVSDPKARLLTVEREQVDAGIPAVSTFLRRTTAFIEKMGGADLLIEGRLASSFAGKTLKFFDNKGFFRGVLDLGILFKNRPHMMVIDHKTGKNRGINYYNWQFLTYTLLAKVNYPHITHVVPAIHWVQDTITEIGNPIKVPSVPDLLDKVVEHLNQATGNAAINLDVGQPSKLCGWCDYQILCPLSPQVIGAAENECESDKGSKYC